MSDLRALIDEINAFRDARDWRQFHNAKDLALSISLESNELLEHFQWRSADETVSTRRDGLAEELADVLIYALMMADDLDFDVAEIVRAKLAQNGRKYPIERASGSKDKYTEL